MVYEHIKKVWYIIVHKNRAAGQVCAKRNVHVVVWFGSNIARDLI
jgi:hypothetical protein